MTDGATRLEWLISSHHTTHSCTCRHLPHHTTHTTPAHTHYYYYILLLLLLLLLLLALKLVVVVVISSVVHTTLVDAMQTAQNNADTHKHS